MTIPLDYLNPLKSDDQDRLVVAGLQFPGICTVQGVEDSDDIQVKKPTGSAGASITNRGRNPSDFTTVHQLWEDEHFDMLVSVIELTKNDPKKPLRGLKMEHPELARANVFYAIRKKVGQLTRKGKQLYEITFSWIQFASPGGNVTADASGNTNRDPKSPDGKDKGKEKTEFGDPELNRQIRELTEKAKEV